MELPVVRCTACGKAYPVNEGIMEQGKVFCSKECQDSHKTKQAEEPSSE